MYLCKNLVPTAFYSVSDLSDLFFYSGLKCLICCESYESVYNIKSRV